MAVNRVDSADSRRFFPDGVYSTDSIHGDGERRAGRDGIHLLVQPLPPGSEMNGRDRPELRSLNLGEEPIRFVR